VLWSPGEPFFGRPDLTRIGMLGWSFGGATSLQMSRDDPRVKAAVNYDGDLFGDVRAAWSTGSSVCRSSRWGPVLTEAEVARGASYNGRPSM
jgi:dienelactone hydrolase